MNQDDESGRPNWTHKIIWTNKINRTHKIIRSNKISRTVIERLKYLKSSTRSDRYKTVKVKSSHDPSHLTRDRPRRSFSDRQSSHNPSHCTSDRPRRSFSDRQSTHNLSHCTIGRIHKISVTAQLARSKSSHDRTVRTWKISRLKRKKTYNVRLSRVSGLLRTLYVFLRLRRLIVQVLTVRSCDDFDRANRAVTELLWVRPIVQWLISCDDWRSLKDLLGPSLMQWLGSCDDLTLTVL